MDYIDRIYESMQGLLEPEAAVPWVDDLFQDGSRCEACYEQMRQAYLRLCQRLGNVDEDDDLDQIVDSLSEIQRILCREMFLCGMGHSWRFGE